MSIKATMVGAALTLSMAPLAARADGYYDQQQPYDQQQYNQSYDPQYQQQPTYQYQQPGIAVGEPSPYPTDRQWDRTGRYELRTVQQFVPGHSHQVWVPEQCSIRERQRGWWRQSGYVCIPGHYDQQWTPGHYESVQQWVWVPFGPHGHHHHFWGGGWGGYNRGI